jgi:hypothetical protein
MNGRSRESRNKKPERDGYEKNKKENKLPAVKPALLSPSTRYNVCILPPFVRDMNPSQTGGKE